MKNEDGFANYIQFKLSGLSGSGKVGLIDFDKKIISKVISRSIFTRRMKKTKNFYAFIKYKKKAILLSRLIMGVENNNNVYVDHINGDTLDNRRSNLRICTFSENMKNRIISRSNRTGFKGVSVFKRGNTIKYVAKIQNNKVRKNLGYYKTAEEAAKRYDDEAKMLHGNFAKTNFKNNGHVRWLDDPTKN